MLKYITVGKCYDLISKNASKQKLPLECYINVSCILINVSISNNYALVSF